ncbi:MAG: tRNA (adenosine(37)-N6)-threonylcarbamoyltransferase complex ATPase subunit type 1 TsaE [Deltaproteobacteria bacterium]|nr:MAG: tRNA (adenosine(37)-N6)-threonylcarbamoyltransferase complex ATPase subunit type 1 TsaE [Deltaproteobacteria bacterium]
MTDDQPLLSWERLTRNPAETKLLAEGLGRLLQPGDVIALMGELGSGKTLFSQGLARGLQVPEAYYITSPTFAIINEYPGRIPFYHLDLYRISAGVDLLELGLDEVLYGQGAVAIEWAERLKEQLPGERLEVHLAFSGEAARHLDFLAFGVKPELRLQALIENMGNTRVRPSFE